MILFLLLFSLPVWAVDEPSHPSPQEELIAVTMTPRVPLIISEVQPIIPNHNLYVYTVRIQNIDAVSSVFVTVVWDYDLEPSSHAVVRTWIHMGGITAGFDAQAAALDWVEETYQSLSPGQIPDSPSSTLSQNVSVLSPEPDSPSIEVLRSQLRTLRDGYLTPPHHEGSQ